MRKHAIGVFAALATFSPALAGEMSGYGAAPAKYDWTGVYIGGHIGAGWQSTRFQDPSATTNLTLCCELIGTIFPGSSASNSTDSSFLGGGQIGGRYQIGRLVVGSEASLAWTGLNNSAGVSIPAYSGSVSPSEVFKNRTDWIASLTGSIGYAQDRWLAYGKGGVALAHNDYSLDVSGVGNAYGGTGPFTFHSAASDTRVGVLAGVGLKWALGNNWSTGVEYNYMYFPSKSVDFPGTIQFSGGAGTNGPATFNTNNTQQISDVKIDLEYRF